MEEEREGSQMAGNFKTFKPDLRFHGMDLWGFSIFHDFLFESLLSYAFLL